MKILDSFKDKKFKYGGYATLLVAIVLAILVGVNLLVDLVPLKADLTKEQLYSLSEQTYMYACHDSSQPTSASHQGHSYWLTCRPRASHRCRGRRRCAQALKKGLPCVYV